MQADPDRAQVMRQALAGMLWTKQYFYYDLATWLKEHNVGPETSLELRRRVRNAEWYDMYNDDIISMPDKWEYPWYAAWDLAFHTLALAIVDPDFAKSQLDLMLRNDYLPPNGQMPAYEWNFGDVNSPVGRYSAIVRVTNTPLPAGVGAAEPLPFYVRLEAGKPPCAVGVNAPMQLEGQEVTWRCEAPGAWIVGELQTDRPNWRANYVVTDSSGSKITYGPEETLVVEAWVY